jgi:hypothetical protein
MAAHRFRVIRRLTQPSAAGAWLRIGATAAALLLLSEAIWLWQTWPVRELLR